MNNTKLHRLIDLLVAGDITPDDHAALQQTLKDDPNARAAFRERMDLEAGLRTWAVQPTHSLADGAKGASSPAAPRDSAMRWYYPALGLAASILLVVGLQIWHHFANPGSQQIAEQLDASSNVNSPATVRLVGFIREQEGCDWSVRNVSTAGRFSIGKLKLAEGVAELKFDSGTNLTLEGPCEIDIASIDSACLLAGIVCVNVSELSNGFTLETPESQIIDEGTEYAVSIDEQHTEVHVFGGSVIWIPIATEIDVNSSALEDRIQSGEAKSYLRSKPTEAKRIPFGRRQFVRRLEDRVQEQASGNLVAYDGFENLAGRVRRGRSGFGWIDGWQVNGRGRGKAGEIIECSEDVVFGFNRAGRRQLLLENGLDVQRKLAAPLELENGSSLYASVLMQREPSPDRESLALQISLEPDLPGRGRRLHQLVSFGIATDGFPYIRSSGVVTKTATKVTAGETAFCVLKLSVAGDATSPSLRIYRPEEELDATEPSAWTVLGNSGSTTWPPKFLRIVSGEKAAWKIDELKIGTSWSAILPTSQ